ncbi:TrkH family potassium uptake protein, partial [bacterium]|nr:TrkH family potassium uptake protein [bacterium]
GIPGQGISIAEGKGDQLVPNIRKSTRIVIGIYTIYAIFGFIALWLVGMSPFDAINHSFTAISTGGFSTHPDSIGYWNSHSIEIIIIILMILGSLNFMTAFLLLKGKFKAIFRNGEIRLFVLLVAITSLILFFLCQNIYTGVSKTVRVAIFETITALTTTGFSSTVYAGWSPAGYLILIILMIIGGGTNSTAGGIKQYRIYILLKSVLWQIKQSLKPKSQVIQNYVWRGEQKYYIKDETVNKMAIFSFVYILVFFIGSAVLSFHGYSIRDSMFEYASALGTVGLSVGITNINAPGCILWLESVGMFLGRLEFLIVFITIAKIVKDTIRIFKK